MDFILFGTQRETRGDTGNTDYLQHTCVLKLFFGPSQFVPCSDYMKSHNKQFVNHIFKVGFSIEIVGIGQYYTNISEHVCPRGPTPL